MGLFAGANGLLGRDKGGRVGGGANLNKGNRFKLTTDDIEFTATAMPVAGEDGPALGGEEEGSGVFGGLAEDDVGVCSHWMLL